MNTEKIEQLLEKYFEGKSSLEEEQVLQEYFQKEEVAEHLKSYKPQFDFSAEQQEVTPEEGFDAFAKINFAEEKSPFIKGERTGAGDSSGMPFGSSLDKKVLWSLRIAAGIIFLRGYWLITQMYPANRLLPCKKKSTK